MTIGIDIDDTITDTYESFIMEISKFYGLSYDEVYAKKYIYDDLLINPFFKPFMEHFDYSFDNLAPNVSIKPGAKEIINRLHYEGHKIVIITARNKLLYTNAYQLSNDYLINNGILFDKLITDSEDKGKTALDEKIDLFIDDSIKNCLSVYNVGIKVLQFNSSFNEKDSKIKVVNDWNEIYYYTQELLRK